jgi:hypothetical protein
MKSKVKDLTGMQFGKWKVIKRNGYEENGKEVYWFCECSCEKQTLRNVRGYDLRSGKSKSCGCVSQEKASKLFKSWTKHNMCDTNFYRVWCNIKDRCLNKNCKAYKNYGDRDIKICEEWLDFMNFKNDMYDSYLQHCEEYGNKETTIERKDVNGDYNKNNCTWATKTEQNVNKRNVIIIEIEGEKHAIPEWGRLYDLKSQVIRNRYSKGVRGKDLLKPSRNKKGR